ncbi:MAG: hypothetical protein ACK4SM_01520 [Aquificaceae bacterium]
MKDRLTLDISLKELLENQPKVRDILYTYGINKLEELDVEDTVLDKLTLRGFFRLMDLDDETQGFLWEKMQHLYREMEE